MAGVNVNAQIVHKQIQEIKKTAVNLEKMQKDMRSKYQAAGSGWRDKKYAELGDIVQESVGALVQMQKTLSFAEQNLNRLLREIQEYEAVNLRGGSEIKWVNGQAVEIGQLMQETTVHAEEESIYAHRMEPEEVNRIYEDGVQSIDEVIENYREALMKRGVPDGAWMRAVLAQHRAAMLENLGYDLDLASGHGEDSVNRHRPYVGPEANPNFYEELVQQYRSSTAPPSVNDYGDYLLTYGLSEKADFGVLDERTVRDLCDAVREVKEQFPEIDLKFVGSLQARNTHLEEKLTAFYLEEYRKHYKGASDEELMPYVRQNVEEDLRGFEAPPNVIAQSLFVENSCGPVESAVMDFNGITINERFGADYDYFMSVREEDVRTGWKPQNCVSPRATVDHELGHQIANYVGAHEDAEIQDLFRQFSQLDRERKGQVLSGYAGESIHEFLAEAWSEYRNNPQCRECARRVAERMTALYEAGRAV